jgi:hypothetical protein
MFELDVIFVKFTLENLRKSRNYSQLSAAITFFNIPVLPIHIYQNRGLNFQLWQHFHVIPMGIIFFNMIVHVILQRIISIQTRLPKIK